MENASKALLIAGAALLVILLLTVMFNVFGQMAGSASSIYSDLEESDITEFNQQFLNFEGDGLTIQDVVTIINIAKDNNETERMPVTVTVNITWHDISCEIARTKDWQDASVDEINELLAEKLSSLKTRTYTCKIKYKEVDDEGLGDVRLVGTVNIEEVVT